MSRKVRHANGSARKLTDKQRAVMMAILMETKVVHQTTPRGVVSYIMSDNGHWEITREMQSLEKRGLIEATWLHHKEQGWVYTLTPLGRKRL